MFKKFSAYTLKLNNRTKNTGKCAVFATCMFIFSPLSSAAVVSDFFGTWNGTWNVDEKYNGLTPLTPPFDPATVQLNIGEFDSIEGNYGTVFVESALSGVISSISVTGNDVQLSIDYPAANFETSGTIIGVISGNKILGNFDEIPAAGWTAWKGPIDISKTVVPVPGAVWLFVSSLIGLASVTKLKFHRVKIV
jgi:hypothetical protein